MWWAHVDAVMNLLYHNTQEVSCIAKELEGLSSTDSFILATCADSAITGVSNSESQMHIIEHCVTWKVANRVDNLVLPVLQFQNKCVWYNIPSWADINHCRINDCFMEC